MQISKSTINILKNFQTINGSILVKPGNQLETISATKNILASAEIGETFETEFGIYDLSEFLNVITGELLGADCTFKEDHVVFSKGKGISNYVYADSSTIVSPENKVSMPDPEISFTLTQEDLNSVRNMSSVLGKSDLAVCCDGESISLRVMDKRDPKLNNYSLSVGGGHNEKFTMYFKVENLKIIGGDYDVKISSGGISYLKHTEIPVEYWIALEPDSMYGENA